MATHDNNIPEEGAGAEAAPRPPPPPPHRDPFAPGRGRIVGAKGGAGPFCKGHGVPMDSVPTPLNLPPGHCKLCGLECGHWEGEGIDPRNMIPCAAAPPGGTGPSSGGGGSSAAHPSPPGASGAAAAAAERPTARVALRTAPSAESEEDVPPPPTNECSLPGGTGGGHYVGVNGGAGPLCGGHGLCMDGFPAPPDLPPGHCKLCGLEGAYWVGDGPDPRNNIPCAAARPDEEGIACASAEE